jgi:hypothetical protein
MKASGLGTAPRKLLDEMKEIKSLDVLLPTRGEKYQAPRGNHCAERTESATSKNEGNASQQT